MCFGGVVLDCYCVGMGLKCIIGIVWVGFVGFFDCVVGIVLEEVCLCC